MRVYTRFMDGISLSIPCHCGALRRAARIVTELYDRDLAGVGLTLPQFSLLRRLKRVEPVSITRFSEVVHLERTTLGRNLKPLQNSGLIESRASDKDARVRVICLTKLGKSTLERAMPVWRRTQKRLESSFGPEQLSLLRDLLGKIDKLQT